MSIDVAPVAQPQDSQQVADKPASHAMVVLDRLAWQLLRVLSSLKLTVALFVMGIFIILVGTLAQVDMDMWEVIDTYFRSWITSIDFQVFFPRTWFPNWQSIPYGFWFPGGAAIGAAMVVNLLAAHLVRFKTQASGRSMIVGTAVLIAGVLLTGYVIVSGHNQEGLQGQPPFSWETLWTIVKVGMVALSLGLLYGAWSVRARYRGRAIEWGLLAVAGVTIGLFGIWAIGAKENAYLGDAGMRILWQLIQASICGLVLLAACRMIFRKRAGIVVIHLGIGLMMFGQFFVAKYDIEEQMRIEEGQTRSYGEDTRQTELAIVDTSDSEQDKVTVIPRGTLLASAAASSGKWSGYSGRPDGVDGTGIIRAAEMPFDLQVVEYYQNHQIEDASKAKDKNPATAGFGKEFVAIPARPASGADSDGRVDLAAAYVKVFAKDSDSTKNPIGTFLLSQYASFQNLEEKISVGDKTYQVSLRFRRHYKPYQITLLDVRKDDYVGTSTPRNYSSDVRLVDESRGVDRQIHIWMNNPLRYAGETFYQSGYTGPPDSQVEATTLSVVTNAGWMIPYVSCMIVVVGLASHFLGTLLRFLRRPSAGDTLMKWGVHSPGGIGLAAALLALLHRVGRKPRVADKQAKKKVEGKGKSQPGDSFQPSLEPVSFSQTFAALFPWLIVGAFALMLVVSMRPKARPDDVMQIEKFGRLPVVADGRVKPFDTLARNTLRVISNKESFKDSDGDRQPAIRWLLDAITERADQHPVMRIDNLEVLDTLGLKRRKSHLYSINEIRNRVEEFEKQVDQAQLQAREKGAENLTTYQKKLLELDRRIRSFTRVAAAFQPPMLPELPSAEDFKKDPAAAQEKMLRFRDSYVRFSRSIDSIQPPLAVPMKGAEPGVHEKTEGWESYAKAYAAALIDAKLLGQSPPPALRSMNEILVAYSNNDPSEFNQAVKRYEDVLRRDRPAELVPPNTFWNRMVERTFGSFYGFEEWFNQVAPFHFCWYPYVMAAVLAALSWLVWREPLIRAAWWLACFAFVIHTLALAARIYISGRPPVTNLYSSAVFIGWAVVAFCLIWEWLYRNGLATFLGSLLAFSSLVVAHSLAADGDTFTVLQAVLDTQFWLATHVVCITLGYATTFVAGGLGAAYIVRGILTPSLTPATSKEMGRMIYGTTCFALFFSFFGTVLGGLWADDSWGRFWGWDPKENGALIIVLWNALILHAHWDGMAKDRGMAVLAVFGNIVTSWSWFGVNQLQIGLHSYGFTEGVLYAWFIFSMTQLALIVAGSIPKRYWWSTTAQKQKAIESI